MNKLLFQIVMLTCVLLPLSSPAQDDGVQAAVSASIQQDKEIWTGQQLTFNLDLKTTGYSFSNTRFNLPEINGAFLMQIDTTTIRLSERIDGKTWQVLRYPLALYPQIAGSLEIPPIDVRFITSAGFGNAEKEFEFSTESLKLDVKLPPGARQDELVITTQSFELEHEWQPAPEAAKTGDAFTLTVTRRASDISAMLLPPIPVYRTDGLAAYPQSPEVTDKSIRGSLTGERVDTVIWVVEKPGQYNIPGVRFQWWDPIANRLDQQTIPGLNLDVIAASGDLNTALPEEQGLNGLRVSLAMALMVILVLISGAFWWRYGIRKPDVTDNEKAAFKKLQRACQQNHPGQSLALLYAWLEHLPTSLFPPGRSLTLAGLTRTMKNQALADQLQSLQQAVVTQNKAWRGDDLAGSLRLVRRLVIQTTRSTSKSQLAALNP